MALNFYRVPHYRHRDIWGCRRTGEQITKISCGAFLRIRTYLISTYNADLGVALWKRGDDRSDEEKEMVADISPWIPEALWPFFCTSDCGGEWSTDEVKGFVEEFRKNKYLTNIEGKAPYVQWDEHMPEWQRIPHREWKYSWDNEMSNNDWLNEQSVIQEVNRFIGNIYQASINEGYGVLWS